MKLLDLFEAGPPIDNVRGLGAVGASSNIDYLGLRVLVKPSVFLKLATPHPDPRSDYIEQHIAAGEPIGAPFLDIYIPDEWFSQETTYNNVVEGDLSKPARIIGHEGRHRMTAVLKIYGDEPVETHILLNGLRRRHLTDRMIARLNESIVSQTRKLVRGPWFTQNAITEGDSATPTDEELAHIFDSHFKNKQYNLIATGLRYFKIKHVNIIPEIKEVLDNNIDQLIAWFLKPTNQPSAFPNDFSAKLYDVASLIQSGYYSDKFDRFLNDNKQLIIRTILLNIKAENRYSDELVKYVLPKLKKLKLGWPELTAIEKSKSFDRRSLRENFADGKGPGRPGDSRRHGIPKNATLAQLDSIGKGSGRKAQLARWQANMRRGRRKAQK